MDTLNIWVNIFLQVENLLAFPWTRIKKRIFYAPKKIYSLVMDFMNRMWFWGAVFLKIFRICSSMTLLENQGYCSLNLKNHKNEKQNGGFLPFQEVFIIFNA